MGASASVGESAPAAGSRRFTRLGIVAPRIHAAVWPHACPVLGQRTLVSGPSLTSGRHRIGRGRIL